MNIGADSLSIPIEDPFRLDMDSIIQKIEFFISSRGETLDGLDIKGLLAKMVKGIAGCENGCPADAKNLVCRGVKKFKLEYIEGGILSATATTQSGKNLCLKMFPEF